MFNKIDGMITKPVKYDEKDLQRRGSLSYSNADVDIEKLLLKPKEKSKCEGCCWKFISLIAFICTTIIIITEITLIINPNYTLPSIIS